jgi:hypothetical protein
MEGEAEGVCCGAWRRCHTVRAALKERMSSIMQYIMRPCGDVMGTGRRAGRSDLSGKTQRRGNAGAEADPHGCAGVGACCRADAPPTSAAMELHHSAFSAGAL